MRLMTVAAICLAASLGSVGSSPCGADEPRRPDVRELKPAVLDRARLKLGAERPGPRIQAATRLTPQRRAVIAAQFRIDLGDAVGTTYKLDGRSPLVVPGWGSEILLTVNTGTTWFGGGIDVLPEGVLRLRFENVSGKYLIDYLVHALGPVTLEFTSPGGVLAPSVSIPAAGSYDIPFVADLDGGGLIDVAPKGLGGSNWKVLFGPTEIVKLK